jgi:hypothetical protein
LLLVALGLWAAGAALAQASAPVLWHPANGATGVPQTALLKWRAVADATSYQVQVATDEEFAAIVAAREVTTTQAEIPGLAAETQYYWRVRAVVTDQAGSWSAIWSFTTGVTRPGAAPRLLTPANGSENLLPPIEFTWTEVPRAVGYQLQIARTRSFEQPVVNQLVPATAARVGELAPNMLFYWRVRAHNTAGEGPWSAIWCFKTRQGAVEVRPQLVAPRNNATNVPLNVKLQWTAVARATGYQVQVATDERFTNLVADPQTTVPYHHLTGLQQSTKYFWRARAFNAAGEGPWSVIWRFTTTQAEKPTAAPVLVAPANGAEGVTAPVELRWEAVERAAGYRVQVSRREDFSNFVHNIVTRDTVWVLREVPAGTRLFWRVQAYNPAGAGPFSAIWRFTTPQSAVPPATAPVLLHPANNAVGVPTTARLTWQAVARATGYRVLVASDEGFGTIFYQETVAGLVVELTNLQIGTRYYWKVQAVNAFGPGPWSQRWSFTVGQTNPPTAAPVLVHPANGATGVPTSPRLTWQRVERAGAYEVQVARDEAFTEVFKSARTDKLFAEISGLAINTRYYWRARGLNNAGEGPWSAIWRFNTLASPPPVAAPALLHPANEATGVAWQPTEFSWRSVERAHRYQLQVSKNAEFSYIIINNFYTTTSAAVNTLAENTLFWRVRAVNAAGEGPWSTIRSFTTAK